MCSYTPPIYGGAIFPFSSSETAVLFIFSKLGLLTKYIMFWNFLRHVAIKKNIRTKRVKNIYQITKFYTYKRRPTLAKRRYWLSYFFIPLQKIVITLYKV